MIFSGVGVVRADLSPLIGIEEAFEQRAEDSRVDRRPVLLGDRAQHVEGVGVERQRLVVVEQAAVEVQDMRDAEIAAGPHFVKQVGQHALRTFRDFVAPPRQRVEHLFEQVVLQQVHVLGEQAEHDAVEEVRDLLRRVALHAQPLGDGGEVLGDILGDLLAGLLRLQALGMPEDVAQKLARAGMRQVFDRKLVPLLNRVGPVGIDAETLGVGDDEQRRIFQRHRIELQLLIGAVEVGAVLLVFPAEVSALPDIGKAPGAIELGDAFLEAVTVRIGCFVRRRLAQHTAQIDEMLLRRLPLGTVGAGPLVDEFGRRHRGRVSRRFGGGPTRV